MEYYRCVNGGISPIRYEPGGWAPKALGVEPKVLAAQPASEDVENRELQMYGYVGAKVHFRGGTVLAYDLVRDRYGVDMWEVIDAAPFLFALLAEMSLADRRRRLEEMVAAWETYQTTVPEHIGFAAVGDCNEGLLAELDSIAERDLSGVRILRKTSRGPCMWTRTTMTKTELPSPTS